MLVRETETKVMVDNSNNSGNGAGGDPAANGPATNPGVKDTPGAVTDPASPPGLAETHLNEAASDLAPVLIPKVLTPQERKQTPKVRKKAEGMIPVWLQLGIAKPGIAPGRDPKALLARYLVLVQLRVLVTLLHGLAEKASDTVLVGLSDIWKAVLAIYGTAQHMPGGDPSVTVALSQMQSVMSTGPRLKKSTKAALAKPIPHSKKGMAKALMAQATVVPPEGTAPAAQSTAPQAAGPAPVGTGNTSHPQPTPDGAANGAGGTPAAGGH